VIAGKERQRQRDEAEQQHKRAERDRIATATGQREHPALDRATANILAGAVPIGVNIP
jgi:hypothetical protein